MKIGFWNVRGFNRPLKQNGVAHLVKENQLCLLGILETKLTAPAITKILHRSFLGWCHTQNFDTVAGGHMLIIWNPAVTDLQPEDISPKSFTAGSMWEKLMKVGQSLTLPWLILGDFNCVKSMAEKQLGVVPTWYELKDFNDCCLSLGLTDAPTTGCYYTWYSNNDSNPVWCKLNRVLLNNKWLEAGLQYSAQFNPPGCLSDHSPTTVEEGWNLNVEGSAQFKLCSKLKALKDPLKAFSRLHYSHITIREKEADIALQNTELHVQDSLGALRKKAVFLAKAERHFYYRKAKIHFLKMGTGTQFFHDMVKRNAAKSSILAITKSDGSTITSEADIGQEFVAYFTSLLGTEAQTLPVDRNVF
ncbi:UNVERIFIED_CONTAM: hypothetical protein Slati_0405400 [Sesamum latifolium]|uniref:Endonuclease/exonuclease/phosphatase domain-containing protein n=1 Tax=Sesamum latifolium TaxID=2727402 RepID=A0AAW2XUG8_9LAMI